MKKDEVLRRRGCFNSNFENVNYNLFRTGGRFFDTQDKLQVRYEMIRAVQVDGLSITEAARLFGYSRETYYTVARDFGLEGCVGLLDEMQDRRKPEKLTPEVVDFILQERHKSPQENSGYELARKVEQQFALYVHPRTIYKVLKKKLWDLEKRRPSKTKGTLK